MSTVPKYLDVVVSTLEEGMDSGRSPSSLSIRQTAFNVNATCRSGYPEQRPGYNRLVLNFQSDEDARDEFVDGRFQGASYFRPLSGPPCLVVSISGVIFRINVGAAAINGVLVQDISPPGNGNSPVLTKAWFCQAEDFLIIQDNQSAPIIYDGATSRRSTVIGGGTLPEVPVGNVMAYSMGRLWVALPGGYSFVGGNIVYGEGGSPAYSGRDSVLKFSENELINGGGAFGVPIGGGEIRAMQSVAQIDTSTGQGPLQVFTTTAVFSVQAPPLRSEWATVNYPVQTVSLTGAGALGASSATLVNGDVWFRAVDGIRSFIVARRDFGGWGNTPMSTPMDEVLRYDTENLLYYGSAVLFDNRLLMTCSPVQKFGHGVYHRGLIALDFHRLSGIPAETATGIYINPPPAYDGLWTGLNILQVVAGEFNGTTRAFAFVLNDCSQIELWEISKNLRFDYLNSPSPTAQTKQLVQWSVRYASYGFADGGRDLKKLETGDLWVDKVWGSVGFTLQYRPDQSPAYQNWATWAICAKNEGCDAACSNPPVYRDQYRSRMRFPLPSESCEANNGKPYRHGFEFQPRLFITGYCRLKKMRLRALAWAESAVGKCQPQTEECLGAAECDFDPFTYGVEECGDTVPPLPPVPPPDPPDETPLWNWPGVGELPGPPMAGCDNPEYITSAYYWGINPGQNPNENLLASQVECSKAMALIRYNDEVAANPDYTYTMGQYFWFPNEVGGLLYSAEYKWHDDACDPNDPTGDHLILFNQCQGMGISYCRTLN